MSKVILNSLIAGYSRANGFFEKFIEVCPENIWAGKIGKFPVWQQVYHTYATFGFFLTEKGVEPALKPLYPQEVVLFKTLPDTPPAKPAIAGFLKEANALVEKFFASLEDDKLGNIHEGFSARRGTPVTNAGVIISLNGHLFYHFGQCDATLRDHGLEGLF